MTAVIDGSCPFRSVRTTTERRSMRTLKLNLFALSAAAALVAAGAARSGSAGFSTPGTNPWFPLKPGTTGIYNGTGEGKSSREVLTVSHRTKTIAGARCAVVKDMLYVDGHLRERTTDWYTQD